MPKGNTYTFKAKVWLYPGPAAWHFISLPKKQSNEIKTSFGELARGWGSLPIQVKIGSTSWKTSIFPGKKKGAYLVPLKADVRKKEDISVSDVIKITLEIQP